MGLFKKFREPIFLKEDSNLEKQIEDLKNIADRVDDKDGINKQINSLQKGLDGEKQIAYQLKNSNIGMYILHDITVKVNDCKSQIDYLIVTQGYCYVVECKNLNDNITVDNIGQFQIGEGKFKRGMDSPYEQAKRHIETLKKIWLSEQSNNILTGIREKYFDTKWYKPLVVISNSKSILNVRFAPKEIKEHIVKVDQLVSYIKNDLEKYDKQFLNSQKEAYNLAIKYKNISVDESNNFVNKYKEEIEKKNLAEKLRAFRKEKSQYMKVPAYYIFTDEEMEKLIDSIPQDIDELFALNILPEIKIKCHGEEILKILNDGNK